MCVRSYVCLHVRLSERVHLNFPSITSYYPGDKSAGLMEPLPSRAAPGPNAPPHPVDPVTHRTDRASEIKESDSSSLTAVQFVPSERNKSKTKTVQNQLSMFLFDMVFCKLTGLGCNQAGLRPHSQQQRKHQKLQMLTAQHGNASFKDGSLYNPRIVILKMELNGVNPHTTIEIQRLNH